MKKKLLYIR